MATGNPYDIRSEDPDERGRAKNWLRDQKTSFSQQYGLDYKPGFLTGKGAGIGGNERGIAVAQTVDNYLNQWTNNTHPDFPTLQMTPEQRQQVLQQVAANPEGGFLQYLTPEQRQVAQTMLTFNEQNAGFDGFQQALMAGMIGGFGGLVAGPYSTMGAGAADAGGALSGLNEISAADASLIDAANAGAYEGGLNAISASDAALIDAANAGITGATGGLPTIPAGGLEALTQAPAPVVEMGRQASLADIARIGAQNGLVGTGLTSAISRVISGNPTSNDLLKLGLTAAGAAALALENPDRTSTNEIKYPEWYTQGAKSALAQADKFAALGPNSVAPLSANENAAIDMARDSSGVWQPMLDRAGTLANEAAGGIPSIDLSAYMNPYLDNVLKPIQRRNEIAKAQSLNDLKAKAGMMGAFGGSRSDILLNQTAESADRNMNEIEANIRSNAFTTGLNTAQSDLARKLSASNQFTGLGTATGALTDDDITRLTATGGLERKVEQDKLNAPLTAIGGYAAALRGAGNPGSTSTSVAPEASKVGQVVGGLTALYGANQAGIF